MPPAKQQDLLPGAEASRLGVAAWCLYDWANSAFPTVIITFVFAAYFTEGVAEDSVTGTALWGQAMGLSALAVAVMSPILGAIADRGGRRKPWLFVATCACVAFSVSLWTILPDPSMALTALVLVACANVAFELGMVFYNAMLADMVASKFLGRVSGWWLSMSGLSVGVVCADRHANVRP